MITTDLIDLCTYLKHTISELLMKIVALVLAARSEVIADLVELIAQLLDCCWLWVGQPEVVGDYAGLIAPSRLGLRRRGFALAEAIGSLAEPIHSRRLDLLRIESIDKLNHACHCPDWNGSLIRLLRINRIPKSPFHPKFGMHRRREQVNYSNWQYLIKIPKPN